MNFDFTGKVVLITGASGGIGACTAELFSKCGASLVLTGRNETKLKEVCKKCADVSPNKLEPLPVIVELTNEDAVVKLVEQTIEKYKSIDVLVNNAGVLAVGALEKMSLDEYDKLMNVNLRTIFHLTKLCIPHLASNKGNIVNVSSLYGLRAFSGCSVYCTSKAALDHFTRCTALELASKGVRVNAVNPGPTKTEMLFDAFGSSENVDTFVEKNKEAFPFGRAGEADDIASAIVFLSSNHASFITGVSLPVDGGKQLMCPR